MGKTSGESNRANRNEKSEMRRKIFARAREKNFAKFFFARVKNFARVRNCKNLEMHKILPKIKKVRKNHFLLEKLSKKCILEIFFTFVISDRRRKFLMRFNRGTEIPCGNWAKWRKKCAKIAKPAVFDVLASRRTKHPNLPDSRCPQASHQQNAQIWSIFAEFAHFSFLVIFFTFFAPEIFKMVRIDKNDRAEIFLGYFASKFSFPITKMQKLRERKNAQKWNRKMRKNFKIEIFVNFHFFHFRNFYLVRLGNQFRAVNATAHFFHFFSLFSFLQIRGSQNSITLLPKWNSRNHKNQKSAQKIFFRSLLSFLTKMSLSRLESAFDVQKWWFWPPGALPRGVDQSPDSSTQMAPGTPRARSGHFHVNRHHFCAEWLDPIISNAF